MIVPWDDEVTASIDVDGGRQIITQGPLRLVVPLLAARSAAERNRIVIAFPDRRVPPFRYDGAYIDALAAALHKGEGGPA
jgi:hypothetical protein